MMEMIWEVVGFALKALMVVIAAFIVFQAARGGGDEEPEEGSGLLRVKNLNDEERGRARALKLMLLPPSARRDVQKATKRDAKREAKQERKELKRTLKAGALDEGAQLSPASPAPSRPVERPAGEEQGQEQELAEGYDAEDADGADGADGSDTSEGAQLPRAKRPRLFVLDFEGDIQASAVESLRQEVSAVLTARRPGDHVLVRLRNAGGYVHTHGLAASQLKRLKEHGLPLWVTVDEVAASGGYMMACVADKIFAAPFALVGSIGVVAQMPNFHRLLQRFDVDVELHTAGKYKRTLTTIGENTPEAREKFVEELQVTHALFKEFVSSARPALDVERVATGETWLGARALEVGLVDEVSTSDEVIRAALRRFEVFSLQYRVHRRLTDRFWGALHALAGGRLPS